MPKLIKKTEISWRSLSSARKGELIPHIACLAFKHEGEEGDEQIGPVWVVFKDGGGDLPYDVQDEDTENSTAFQFAKWFSQSQVDIFAKTLKTEIRFC